MLTYQKLVKRPLHLHRLTGLSLSEFDQLFDKFQSSWNIQLLGLSKNPGRKRKMGGGRHPRLESLEDKLLFILVYVRMYPLLFLQGVMFDLEEGNVSGYTDSCPF